MPYDILKNHREEGGDRRHDAQRMLDLCSAIFDTAVTLADAHDMCPACFMRTLSAHVIIVQIGDEYLSSYNKVSRREHEEKVHKYLDEQFMPTVKLMLEGLLDEIDKVEGARPRPC